jgi:hypothetical protein
MVSPCRRERTGGAGRPGPRLGAPSSRGRRWSAPQVMDAGPLSTHDDPESAPAERRRSAPQERLARIIFWLSRPAAMCSCRSCARSRPPDGQVEDRDRPARSRHDDRRHVELPAADESHPARPGSRIDRSRRQPMLSARPCSRPALPLELRLPAPISPHGRDLASVSAAVVTADLLDRRSSQHGEVARLVAEQDPSDAVENCRPAWR